MAAREIKGNEEEDVVTKTCSKKNRSTSRFIVDMTKPMANQVARLSLDYDEWVHDPVKRRESPRIFESNLLEFVTRCKWWMIPLIWIPVVAWSQVEAVAKGLPTNLLPLTFTVGLLLWTFVEYLLHRFLFHMTPSGAWTKMLHYVVHGFHHKFPMDSDRLVFPPLYTAAIASAVWKIMGFVLKPTWNSSIFGGLLFGYVCYDLTHYYLHYGAAYTGFLYKRKKEHYNHHFKNGMHHYGFGVTSSFWDAVFGTLPPAKNTYKGPIINRQAVAESISPACCASNKGSLDNNNAQKRELP